MTKIMLPAGMTVDFEDMQPEEIKSSINAMREKDPSLFEERAQPEEEIESIQSIYDRSRRRESRSPKEYSLQEQKALLPEVTDKSFRFNLGRKDTDEEKLNYIRTVMGSTEAVKQDADGSFLIDQGLLSDDVREEFGLKESGLVYADRPGFTWYDMIDFGGEAGAPLVGGIGASLLVAGTGGLIVPLAAVAAGTAAVKGLDEAVEYFNGYNRQSLGEVGSAIATEAAFAAAGEGAGRAITKAFGRLFKGKGPKVSQSRIDELEASGLDRKLAEKAAYEEARQEMNRVISEGGVPSIEVATDKGLLGSMQAIYELILPNRKIAQQNTKFIKKTLDDLSKGRISGDDARVAMESQASTISKAIQDELTDPKKATDHTRKTVLGILQKEMDNLVNNYSSTTGVATDFDEAAKLTATLYTQATRRLYQQADDILNVEVQADDILKAIDDAQSNPFFSQMPNEGTLFEQIRAVAKEGKGPVSSSSSDTFNLNELQQMKEALRIARGDSNLVAAGGQKSIDDIIRTIDDVRGAEHARITESLADDLIPTEAKKNIVKGLNQWEEANKLWGEGQEIYNKASVNTIIKDAKNGKYVANQGVIDAMDPGDPTIIRQYLDAVTPPDTVRQLDLSPDKVGALEEVRAIISKPDVTQEDLFKVNNILKQNGLSDIQDTGVPGAGLTRKQRPAFIIPEANEWVGKPGVDDGFKSAYLNNYAEEIDNYINLARAGTEPRALRENVREGLAKKWIENAIRKSPGDFGDKSPKTFAMKYFSLDKSVRKELFGADNVDEMDAVINDFYLSGKRTAEDIIDSLPVIRDQSLKDQILNLKKVVDEGAELNSDDLIRSIASGNIDQPEAIAEALLKDPSSYAKLVSRVGEEAIEGPGGVKDMVMRNLLEEPFDLITRGQGVAEDFIQSGKWGAGLRKAIEKQNVNEGLDTVLGKDTVKDLLKLADDAVKISDGPMASTSIAGPGRKIAMATALAGGILNPALAVAALGPLAATYVGARLLRNKTVLKTLTSPRLREKEYRLAKAKGARIDKDAAKEQMFKKGPREERKIHLGGMFAYNLNKLMPIVNSEIGILTSTGIGRGPSEEDLEDRLLEAEAPNVQPTGGSELDLPDTTPRATMLPGQRSPNPGGLTAGELALRQIEEAKLMGGGPT